MRLADDTDRARRRDAHQDAFTVRPALRRDPERDYAFELAGGVLAIAVVALGCLLVAIQALRWMGMWR